MELQLNRKWFGPGSTLSELSVNGLMNCYILEDTDRNLTSSTPIEEIKAIKVKGKTCIPSGRYEVVITFSNRFQRMLPLLLNVPGFDGIRIHPGNTAQDTDGCLLPGTTYITYDRIAHSKIAFESLYSQLQNVFTREKIYITIDGKGVTA